ncbi:hypothetical protein [Clostridium thailandense]|uniref:hypothetical protein n=1 Tax=Clostridium thailandense TaxID=2794346 RepID=UPI003989DB37
MFFRYWDSYQDMYRKEVVAYTSNIPIYVNGINVNKNPYPALNYRAYSDIPYYSYVPVAIFNRVGATVVYDSQANTIRVTTDYYSNKDIIKQQQIQIKALQERINKLASQMKSCSGYVQYQGIVEGFYKFSKSYWNLYSNVTPNLIVGNFYKVVSQDAGAGSLYMEILNDSNENVVFRTSNLYTPKGIIYVGKDENGLYVFTWEADNVTSKFKVIQPSNGGVSLDPNKIYVAQRNDDLAGYEGKAYNIVGTNIIIASVS